MSSTHLAAFVATTFVLIAVPGPSVLFAVSRALVLGRRGVLASSPCLVGANEPSARLGHTAYSTCQAPSRRLRWNVARPPSATNSGTVAVASKCRRSYSECT